MGCIPTKTLVGSAKAIYTARRGAEFGFKASEVEVDWARIRARKDAVVASIVSGIQRALERNLRIDLIRGWARFHGPKRLEVDGRVVEAEKVIVASGVAPNVPQIPGLQEAGFLTNDNVMDLDELPGSLLIIGGGPEGMEFGQIFHRFGVKVSAAASGSGPKAGRGQATFDQSCPRNSRIGAPLPRPGAGCPAIHSRACSSDRKRLFSPQPPPR